MRRWQRRQLLASPLPPSTWTSSPSVPAHAAGQVKNTVTRSAAQLLL